MSKSNIFSSIENSEESIKKLQTLFQEFYKDGHSENASDYLNQAAIQNFILSFQTLDAQEGAEEKKGEEVDSRAETKQILSQIELDFLKHLRKEKGFEEQENRRLSNQEIMNRNEAHKDRLNLLRCDVKDQIEEYSGEISLTAPYKEKKEEGSKTSTHIFKAQEIYQYSSEGIKQLTKDLIEESRVDLENVGIVLRPDIKYVMSCFGSLARNEASPYSDLEFGVLLEEGLEEKIGKDGLEEVKEYFRNLTDLINIKVINLGETTAMIQNIKEVKALGLKIPTKNGLSFDGNVLGSCKTPLGNKRAIVKRIEEINQDKAQDIEFIHSNNALSQTQKDEKIAEISATINQRISTLKEDEYELIMTPSQMAQFHDEEWYQRDKHLSTVLYTTDMLQASSFEDGRALLESYQNETNQILNRALEIDVLSEKEQERMAVALSQIPIEDNIKPITLRTRRAFALLEESAGKFEPKAGREQEKGKSFSPKYDFYRPATMLIDHLSYLYDIGNRNREKSVWERFDKLFIDNTPKPTPFPLATADNPNIEGINNLRWMIDRTLQIRLKNYMAKENQNEEMVLLDEYEEKERRNLEKRGLGIYEKEVFEVYYVMMSFYNNVSMFNESKGANIKEFSEKLYFDESAFRKASIHNLFLHYEKSIQYYEQSIAEYHENDDVLYPDVAASLNNLGIAYGFMRNYGDQIASLQQALEISREIFGEIHLDVAGNLNNLGNAYGALGSHDVKIDLLNQSLEIREEILGKKHPDVAASLHNLGIAYGGLGYHKKEIELLNQALKIRKEIFGERHPEVAGSLDGLGNAYGEIGEYQKRIELLNQALKIRKEVLGERHPDVGGNLNNLGEAYGAIGEHKRKIDLLNQSLEITKKNFGARHPDVAGSLNNLGNAYGEMGDRKREIESLNQALEISIEAFGEKHNDVAISLNNLGVAYGAMGKHHRQIEFLEKALAIFDESSPIFASSLANLGSAYKSLKNYTQASEYFEESLIMFSEFYDENHPQVQRIIQDYSQLQNAPEDFTNMLPSDFHNEGCQHHVAAIIKYENGKREESSRLFELARENFEEALTLGGGSSTCVEYANFLYKGQIERGENGDENENQDKIMSLLEKTIDLKDDEEELIYKQEEMDTLPEELQQILLDKIKETDNELEAIEIRPVYLAYFSLIKINLAKEQRSDGKEIDLLAKFKAELDQDIEKGEIDESVIAIGSKLCSDLSDLMQDKKSETPSTSTSTNSAEKVEELAQALKENTSLTSIHLDGNQIGKKELRAAVESVVERNEKAKEGKEGLVKKMAELFEGKSSDKNVSERDISQKKDASNVKSQDQKDDSPATSIHFVAADGNVFHQHSEESIHKLQILFEEFYKGGHSDNVSDYLTQAAIQNFILSFQALDAKEGAEERKGADVDSKPQAKEILSQIELDFLDHLRRKRGFEEQENTRLSNQDIMNRNEVHKEKLALLRGEVTNRIEEYSQEIPTKAPYQNKILEDETAFPPTFKAQEIYHYSSEGIKKLIKALIEESRVDLENVGIVLRPDIQYVISCFGSLARNEASPYSDLEFGVLLEEGLEEKIGKDGLGDVKEYFRNLTDLLNIKVINLGETTAIIQNIKEVKALELEIPTKNGLSFDGNVLGSCKTPLGNKRAIVKRIEEINQDKAQDIALIHSNNALSQTQKDERIAKISENINRRISKLKEDEYELIMTPSQMAQFHNEEWYQRDRHLSTVLYTTDMLQASSLEDGKELLESYQNETNKILNRALEIDVLSEKEQERMAVALSQIPIEDNIKPITLRMRRAFALLEESAGKFEPKAGRDQEEGKSFSPKYDFYRPATMLIDHLSYLYDIGNRDGEKSVWERFDKLFVDNAHQPTPLPLATADDPNIEGINNLRWMIDRTLQIRLKNYMAKENQDEDMILLDEYEEKERKELEQKGLGITEREVFEVYYVMMPFYDDVNRFNDAKRQNTQEFSELSYCDHSVFRKAEIHRLFMHYDKSIQCYEESIKEYKANGKETHLNVAVILNNLGIVYGKIGNHNKKAELLHQSLAIKKKILGDKHPNVATSLNNLGTVYGELGEYHKTIELLQEALAIKKEILGEKHPAIAVSLHNLGNVYGLLGKREREIEVLNQSLAINKECFGEKHPNVATSLNNLGSVYGALGDHEREKELLHQALEIRKECFGVKHPDVAGSLNNLGDVYRAVGDYQRAIEVLNESLAINKEVFGEKHPDVAGSLYNLGNAYGSLGDYKQQIKYLEESLAINDAIFGKNHPNVAASLNNLGNAYGSLGDHKQQIKYYEESLKIREAIFGKNHPDVAESLNNLGTAYGSLGDHKQQIKYCEESLIIKETIFGRNHPSVATSLNNLGAAYGFLGDHKQQIKYLEESLKIGEAIFGRNHPSVAAILNNLGSAYGSLRDHKQEIKYLEESLKIREAIFGRHHPDVADSLYNLGRAYEFLEDYPKAFKLIQEALEISLEFYDQDHPNVQLQIKLYLLLEKEIQKPFICHNQGCKDHINAIIEAKGGNNEESTRLIGLAHNNFEEALRLGYNSNTCVEYANFLIQRKDVIGEDQEKIIFLLRKAIELKDDESELAYDKEEEETLTEELQEILQEKIKQRNDESVMIEVRPIYLAYFLFIKMNVRQELGQENENEKRSDNREVITNLLVQFREELEQDFMKGDVAESAIAIGNKLYNYSQSLVLNQEREDGLDEEELRKAIELSNSKPTSSSSNETLDIIPLTSKNEALDRILFTSNLSIVKEGPSMVDYLMKKLSKERGVNPTSYEVALTLKKLGNAYGDVGNHESQINYWKQSLALYRRNAGDKGNSDPNIAIILNKLAVAKFNHNEVAASISFAKEALGIFRHIYQKDNEYVTIAENNLTLSYAKQMEDSPEKAVMILKDLVCFGELEIIKNLYQNDIDVSVELDNENHNILHEAINGGQLNIITWLIEEGVIIGLDINERNARDNNNSLLHHAVKANDIAIVKYLVEENDAEIAMVNDFGKTALDYAFPDSEVGRYLEEMIKNQTPETSPSSASGCQIERVNNAKYPNK